MRMSQQITIRLPDDLAGWLDQAESKTEVVIAALRRARRDEVHRQVTAELERAPANTADEWGDPAEFTEANRAIIWDQDAR